MRSKLRTVLVAILSGFIAQSFAQFNQDFEPVVGQAISTRDALIQQNWVLPDMTINPEGATPIDGAQSLASGPSYKPDQKTGIATPYLTFSANEDLSFSYKIHRAVMSSCRRWFLVYLADTSSNVTLIDSVEVDGTTTDVKSYSKNIAGYPGTYCIYINFKGDGCNGRFVVDDFHFTGNNANVGYPAHFESPGAVMGINEESGDKQSVNLFPNPASNHVNVEVTTSKSIATQVVVTNLSGARLMTQPVELHNGDNTVQINLNNLAAGSYLLSVKTDEGVITKPLIRIQ